MLNIKNGAMFGLDARIALAIFGALSVISGAALYSAIQKASVTSFVTKITELSKSYEEMYLNTGIEMPVIQLNASGQTFLSARDLIEDNSISGWNGPYWPDGFGINYDNTDVIGRIGFLGYKGAGFISGPKGTTWGGYAANDVADCTSADDCYIWLFIEIDDNNISLAKEVDDMIDNDQDGSDGRLRVRFFGTHYNIYYMVKSSDILID